MTDRPLPLTGIRVLELAQIVAGPFCGALMAEFGAEVIKTELPGKGDDLRRLGPTEDGVNYWYAVDNRGKKVVTLDLRKPKGQDVVRRLVPLCDVVIENFRPGVLESWGLGWEELRKLRPSLVMARVTAFGQTGPLRQGPGFAAIASAFGVMVALRHRDATGEGQWIDAALYESAFRILEYTPTFYGRQGVVRERGGIQHSGWPGGAFCTADGHWVVFTTPAQHLFERLCVLLGQPDLPRDARFASHEGRSANMGELLAMVESWFGARKFEAAMDGLRSHDIPHSPVLSMADIFADPHYRERQTISDVPAEVGPLPQPAVVPRLSATPGRVTHAGPPLGHDTDAILQGLLDMSASEIAALRAERVV